ncbi:flagellar biosynthetic protein FliO [Rhodoferax sp.]|uniref:flagellar biosynthetic protein FliO n=1 Tax=Rhodoferax sp. TaxID=50421 RepID=UPI0039B97B38
MLPWGVKWLQRKVGHVGLAPSSSSRVVSAVAVGPHQRVVTVEVGPEGARVWLVLGVTAQTVTCLHSSPAGSEPGPARASAIAKSRVESGESDVPAT